MMRRREFIAGLGSAAAWPLAGGAQQRAMPVIGFLGATSPESSTVLAPFLLGLKEAGFVDGQNVTIEYRWANGQNDRLPALAADLVNRRVAIICAIGGYAPAIAAKAATATVPIVFEGGGDPVMLGLVASLGRPGGNATGSTNLTAGPIDAKVVEMLRELIPAATSLGILTNPTNKAPGFQTQAAARALRWESQVFEASTDDELKTAFENMAKRMVSALSVGPVRDVVGIRSGMISDKQIIPYYAARSNC
jgi:putative tryptophan/tyrosine transport system substrate-binding protein